MEERRARLVKTEEEGMAASNNTTTLLITTGRLTKALSPYMSDGGMRARSKSLGAVLPPRACGKYPRKHVNRPNLAATIRLIFAH